MLRSLDPRCRRVGFACAMLDFLPAIAGAGSIDAERLKLISARMKEFVDGGSISGAVYLGAYRGQVVALDGVGFRDIENRKPMHADTIVRIMSQTKAPLRNKMLNFRQPLPHGRGSDWRIAAPPLLCRASSGCGPRRLARCAR